MKNAANVRTALLLFAGSLLVGMLSACTSESAPTDRTAMLPDDQRVSTVPWNKPTDWEGRNALGALGNDPRFSGSR